jgi:LysM repeat protein
MKSFYFMACVLLAGTFGCAPQLAQKPLGAEEVRWEKYVKKNYTSWNSPQSIPPDKILHPTPYDKGEIVLGANTAPETPVVTEPAAPAKDSVAVEAAPVVANGPAMVEDKTVQAAPEAAPASSGKFETYTVAKNDSISKIAKKFKSSTSKIKEANQKVLKGSDRIIPGMKLQIPVN